MAEDSHVYECNEDLFSEEEITSYQMPRHAPECEPELLFTPASPTFCVLPSSLRSSVRGKSVLREDSVPRCRSEELPCDEPTSNNPKSCSAPDRLFSTIHKSLGMADKDISWVSSMESIVAEVSPREDFNTIERATFFPQSNEFQHTSQIQPRALFPPSPNESFGFKPLDCSLNSDDAKPYSREMRLSDVCDVLRTLNVINTPSAPINSAGADPFDFNVGDLMTRSPAMFSPKSISQPQICDIATAEEKNTDSKVGTPFEGPLEITEISPFQQHPLVPPEATSLRVERHAAQCTVVFDATLEDNNTCAIETSTKHSLSFDQPSRCTSPSIFSPEVKSRRCSQSEEISTACVLSPIPEMSSFEDSALEIALDGCTNRYSTPIRKSQFVVNKGNTFEGTVSSQEMSPRPIESDLSIPLPELIGFATKVKANKVAKCLQFPAPPDLETPIVAVSSDGGSSLDNSLVPQHAAVPPIVSVTNPCPGSSVQLGRLHRHNQNRNKKLYGSSEKAKPFDVPLDEIWQSLKEFENASSQFLNDKPATKALPESNELVPFSVFARELKETETEEPRSAISLKRSGCLMLGRRKVPKFEESSFAMPSVPLEKPVKRLRLDASPWNSKIQYLVDSQAEVTDTQIFQAVDAIETAIAAETVAPQLVTRQSRRMKKVHPPTIPAETLMQASPDITHVPKRRLGAADVDPEFEGFYTGNQKVIAPSEKSLRKVKQIFDDDLREKSEVTGKGLDAVSAPPEFVGFRTGNETIIAPSEKTLLKMKQIFDEDIASCTEAISKKSTNSDAPSASSKSCGFTGFVTGNKRIIRPSEKSLAKARQMFEQCDPAEETHKEKSDNQDTKEFEVARIEKAQAPSNAQKFSGFMTGNNKILKPSEKALAAVRNMFEAEGMNLQARDSTTSLETKANLEQQKGPFLGFLTGNNSVLKPSDKSLDEVRKMFEDCQDDEEPRESEGEVDSSTAEAPDEEKAFDGFRTGSNTVIKPSTASLNTVRNMFDVDKKKYQNTNEVKSAEPFCGFRTGNNSVIKPSKAALAKVRKLFDEVAESVDKTNMPCLPSGIENVKSSSDASLAQDEVHDEVTRSSKEFTRKSPEMFDEPMERTEEKFEVGKGTSEGLTTLHISGKSLLDKVETGLAEVKEDKKMTTFAGRMDSGIKTTTAEHSTLDDSFSTLLENTDWEETIVPPWLHSSQVSTADPPSTSQTLYPALKRTWPLMDQSGSDKRHKPCNLNTSESCAEQIVRAKRQQARQTQVRLGGKEKGKVRPERGVWFLGKAEGQKGWREMVPEGPAKLDRAQLSNLGVRDFVLDITADNAKDFRFHAKHVRSWSTYKSNIHGFPAGDGFLLILDDAGSAGAAEVERTFLAGPGVAPELVPPGWVANHYGLLVWKLACYERACPNRLAAAALTPDNLMLQLKYRYDREVDLSQSSALKRILECDDPPGKALVLTVLRIAKMMEGFELLLTDGWYTCPARTDPAMGRAVQSGKLQVGTKIMTQGAELVGSEQGVPPLERPSSIYLKIATNSTRRVRWYHKLGFERLRCPPPVPLTSILPGGGNVCCVKVAVVRVYPLVYVEKNSDSRNVTRNSRAEERAANKFQQEQEARMEQLCSQIQHEMASRDRQRPQKRMGELNADSIAAISNPEELCLMLENAHDPGSLEVLLSDEQKAAVWEHQEKRRAQAGRELQEKMQTAMLLKRNVRSVLRVRVVDLAETGDHSALLSWWQPAEELLPIFAEGKALSLFNVTPGNARSQLLYLNSTRQTRVEPLPAPHRPLPQRTVSLVSEVTPSFSPSLGELDVVGLVVYIQNITQGPSTMQTVYLTDSGSSFFGLVFWRGLQEFGCEDTLAEGLVVSASNVQWRRSSASAAIPCGYVTETTLFAHNSKSPLVQAALEEVKQDLEDEDLPTFIESCQDQIITILHSHKNHPNVSLNASANSSIVALDSSANTSVAADGSPCPRPRYLNGFAQRPRASSTPTRTPVQSRLDQLQQMGDPPPLSPIPLRGGGRWSRAFKPPTVAGSPPMDL